MFQASFGLLRNHFPELVQSKPIAHKVEEANQERRTKSYQVKADGDACRQVPIKAQEDQTRSGRRMKSSRRASGCRNHRSDEAKPKDKDHLRQLQM